MTLSLWLKVHPPGKVTVLIEERDAEGNWIGVAQDEAELDLRGRSYVSESGDEVRGPRRFVITEATP